MNKQSNCTSFIDEGSKLGTNVQLFMHPPKIPSSQSIQLEDILSKSNSPNDKNLIQDCDNLNVPDNQRKSNVMGQTKQPQQTEIIFVANQTSSNQNMINQRKKVQSRDNKLEMGLNNVWKHQGLMVLMYIKKFINTIKQNGMMHKFKDLSRHQMIIIGDIASDYSFYKYNNFFYKDYVNKVIRLAYFFYINYIRQQINSLFRKSDLSKKKITNIEKKQIVIQPDGPFKIIWDTIILILMMISVIYVPLRISFKYNSDFQLESYYQLFFDMLPSWAFCLDIILNFTTAYYDKGFLITQRSKIGKHYLRTQFFWDAIIIIPFAISVNFNVNFYLSAILLLRSNKITSITNNIAEMLNLREQKQAIYELIKLVLLIIFIAHLCGCSFQLIGQLQHHEYGISDTWQQIYEINQESWKIQYVSALYWATITMITVGYGDITPKTTTEKIFVICITLVACGVFAYAVNQIGMIANNISRKYSAFKQKMVILTSYMRKRKLSQEMQMKVKKYFEHLNDAQREEEAEAYDMLFNQLPQSFKREVKQEIYSKILLSKKIFKLNFSQQFIEELSLHVSDQNFGPEEYIFSQNDDVQRLYILIQGEVELSTQTISLHNDHRSIFKVVKKGDIFGEQSFFSGQRNCYSAVSANLIKLVYITKQEFIETIQKYPNDYEIFCKIKDSMIQYQSSRGLGLQCASCSRFTHEIENCPFLKYIPNKEQIFKKYKASDQPNQRENYQRNQQRKLAGNTFSYAESIKDTIIQYLIQWSEKEEIEDLIQRIMQIQKEQNEYQLPDESSQEKDNNVKLKDLQSIQSNSSPGSNSPVEEIEIDGKFKDRFKDSLPHKQKSESELSIQSNNNQMINNVEEIQYHRNSAKKQSYIYMTDEDNSYKNNAIKESQNTLLDIQNKNAAGRRRTVILKNNTIILTQVNNDKKEQLLIPLLQNVKSDIVQQVHQSKSSSKRQKSINCDECSNSSHNVSNSEQMYPQNSDQPQISQPQRQISIVSANSKSSKKKNDNNLLIQCPQSPSQNVQQDEKNIIQFKRSDKTKEFTNLSKVSKVQTEISKDVKVLHQVYYFLFPKNNDKTQQIKEEFSVNMDRWRIWNIYFPHNNIQRILQSYEALFTIKYNKLIYANQQKKKSKLVDLQNILEFQNKGKKKEIISPKRKFNQTLQIKEFNSIIPMQSEYNNIEENNIKNKFD